MKTENEKVELILNHKNWTGLSLAELVSTGRISADETKPIWDFTKAALGEPSNMDEFKAMKEIAKLVAGKLA